MSAGSALNKTIGLILLVVSLPIFAVQYSIAVLSKTLGMLSADKISNSILSITASAGIISMQSIIVDFMPLFGIGADRDRLISDFLFSPLSLNQHYPSVSFSLLAGFGLVTRG